MNAWNEITRPLTALSPTRAEPARASGEDTFLAYLQRHRLTIVRAAQICSLPSLLLWRVSHWQPISEDNAWLLVSTLGLATGEHFRGLILTTRPGMRPRAICFPA